MKEHQLYMPPWFQHPMDLGGEEGGIGHDRMVRSTSETC